MWLLRWSQRHFSASPGAIWAPAIATCVPEPSLNVYDCPIPPQMVSMFTLLSYWFWGDVAAFVALRWIDNALLALAVRMPPPGAELGPAIHPEDFARLRAGGAAPTQGSSGAGEAAKRTPNRRRGQKKTN